MSDDTIICRCQEVTEKEIKEAIEEGAVSLNGVKRRTGAGMGLCQGRTCRRLIAAMIAQATGLAPADIEPATVRIPVRPVRIGTLIQEKDKDREQTDC